MDVPLQTARNTEVLSIRRIWANETPAFRAHMMRLDPLSRSLRFGGAVGDAFVEAYTANALRRARVVHGAFDNGTLRAVCELHGSMFSRTGEAAFSVEADWQSMHVGTHLMERLILSARNRGMRHLVISCMKDNLRMRRIAQRFEAEITFLPGEIVGELQPRRADGFSLLKEAIAEMHGLSRAVIDLQAGAVTPSRG